MKRHLHIMPKGSVWAVKKSEAEKASRVTNTKKKVIDISHELEMKSQSELLILGKDVEIRKKNSFDNAPLLFKYC